MNLNLWSFPIAQNDLKGPKGKYNLHYRWVREDFLRPPHGLQNMYLRCPVRSDTYRTVQPQKMARDLAFQLPKEEGLYYLLCVNKVWTASPFSRLCSYDIKAVTKKERHSLKNDSTQTGFEPRTAWSEIQCSNHWAKESTPRRSCQRLVIYIEALHDLLFTDNWIRIDIRSNTKSRFSQDPGIIIDMNKFHYMVTPVPMKPLQEPRCEKTGLWGFPTRSDTNQAVQSQRTARGLKFWI